MDQTVPKGKESLITWVNRPKIESGNGSHDSGLLVVMLLQVAVTIFLFSREVSCFVGRLKSCDVHDGRIYK